jgi:hypothetical protein
MIFELVQSDRSFRPSSRVGESVADHRARLAREQEEKDQRRSVALAGQVSDVNNPSERVHIWEELHGLSLPVNPSHNLLRVIAVATGLQLEQVQEVQKLRLSSVRGHTNGADASLVPR